MKKLLGILTVGMVLSVLITAGVWAQPPVLEPSEEERVNETQTQEETGRNQTRKGPPDEPPGIEVARKAFRISARVLNRVFGSLLAGIFG